MQTTYLTEKSISTMSENDLATLDPSGSNFSCSHLISVATLHSAREINSTPSGNWADFNRIWYTWFVMTNHNKNAFCQELIGDEPKPSSYPNL